MLRHSLGRFNPNLGQSLTLFNLLLLGELLLGLLNLLVVALLFLDELLLT